MPQKNLTQSPTLQVKTVSQTNILKFQYPSFHLKKKNERISMSCLPYLSKKNVCFPYPNLNSQTPFRVLSSTFNFPKESFSISNSYGMPSYNMNLFNHKNLMSFSKSLVQSPSLNFSLFSPIKPYAHTMQGDNEIILKCN